MRNDTDLIDAKTLALLLGRSVSYVYGMKRRGFRMVAYRTTLVQALEWLKSNPQPRAGERRNDMARRGTAR